MERVAALTRHLWQGEARTRGGNHHIYDEQIPMVATTLQQLQKHGSAGSAFWRFGRKRHQSLLDAVGNPRREAAEERAYAEDEARAKAYRAEQQRREEQLAAEREARRPVCARCGEKFTDARWKGAAEYPPGPRWFPTLCQKCQALAIQAAEAEEAEQERQEHQEGRGGWLSRFRS
ncbi:hypothetical protein [Streptomyces sp. WMMB 322]|uniref:hypothetical protein n=1 Tax=Streptomyces sp. WMMB 322 TaxID=1286821 RepID=UPI000823BCD5|nr:hypothetical protein [Streptomyces sp. WMMB 322]SCK13238.1 hypothetical protein H180DRAFT_00802 [Streptomyces sp. WMMB 322]